MAQMLSKIDSATRATRAVRRHLRLSRRQPDAEAKRIAERIIGPLTALERALDKASSAADAAQDAFDDWYQEDQLLDQYVRKLGFRCREWDASRPADQTSARVFGGMTPSEVTRAPRHKQPDLVAQIVVRGRELPEGHSGRELLGDLERLAASSRSAHRAYLDAEQRAGAARAEVDIARLTVIRAYRDNYIDIERACGRDVAEACFPLLRKSRSGIDEERELPPEVDEESKESLDG